MDKKKNYEYLQKKAQGLGADLFGVADIKEIRRGFMLKPSLAEQFERAIVMAVRLSESV